MKVEQIMEVAKKVLLSEITPRLDRIEGRLDEVSCRISDLNNRVGVLENQITMLWAVIRFPAVKMS